MRTPASDLTAQARIRNAAIELFGDLGPGNVSVRAVAEAAEVSPGLVIHHFGSRDGLIDAVNTHLVGWVNDVFAEVDLAAGRFDALASFAEEPKLLAYLARVIIEDEPASRALFDQLDSSSRALVHEWIDAGEIRPVADPAGLAAWLLAADIGVLVLRHHLSRTLGADPFEPQGLERITAVELDVLTNPVFNTGSQG